MDAQGAAAGGQGVGDGWRIVFLGTGASSPFKYRTVSSILLTLPSGGGDVILDAGDGSYGALVRKWGIEETTERLKELRMLWVSHKHADHISGVARILLERRKALGGKGRNRAQRAQCSVCGAKFGGKTSLDMHVRACHPRQRHEGDVDREGGGGGHGGEGSLLIVGPMWLEAWLATLAGLEPGLDYDFVDAQSLTGEGGGEDGGARERVRAAVGGDVSCVLVQHSFPSYGLVIKHSSGFRYGIQHLLSQETMQSRLTDDSSADDRRSIRSKAHTYNHKHTHKYLCKHASMHSPIVDHTKRYTVWEKDKCKRPSHTCAHEPLCPSCVYSGDTRPCDALVEAGKGSTVLLHEATHADDMGDKAKSDRHCTVEEAVDVASRMQCKHTVLTHFSSRFEKLVPDLGKYGAKVGSPLVHTNIPLLSV